MATNTTVNETLNRLLTALEPAIKAVKPYATYLHENYPHEFWLAVTLAAIVSPLLLALAFNPAFDSGSKGRNGVPEAHKDMIVLHVYERPRKVPGLANLVETILRVTQTPYIRLTNTGMSLKGQKPYITYNGEEISDSYFCVKWLEEKMGVSLDSGLEASERGAVEAYRTMIEEGLNWQ
ncbi:hypothetical protein HDU67_002150, partial [Dinochytrium kinnereticum]